MNMVDFYGLLSNYFQLGPLPANQMVGVYDLRLVILSFLVASFASYIALDITGRLRDLSNTRLSTALWVGGGAIAMGAGIWSMHFIGMLAFSMNMPLGYAPGLTILSLFVAVFASVFALLLLKAKVIRVTQTILGGVILGVAIAAMHYTGMAAMNMHTHYLPGLFALSIVIAIIASEAALYLALKSTMVVPELRNKLKIVSAFIMGAAICGMHYTGMASAVFTPYENPVMGMSIQPEVLAMSVAGVTFFILSIAFIASVYKESLNQQLVVIARQAGMAEVATTVLHNVGNVLNSVNVSSLLISEKIHQSKLSTLFDLKVLLKENNNDLQQLIKDERGKHLPQLLLSLADYWENEQLILINEAETMMKHIEHIKNIIATQQNLSRTVALKQIVSVKAIIDEAILITGLDDQKYSIQITRHYENTPPLNLDKAKLLQILVNLIQNAKESILEKDPKVKSIIFTIKPHKGFCMIQITDNGVGVRQDNIYKIFSYGFTTKQGGHGFGLHTSAVAANEMGGNLIASSLGLGHGATFTLLIPYTTVKVQKPHTPAEIETAI